MLQNMSGRAKLIITIVMLIIILLVAYGLFITVSRSGKIAITMKAVPADATVTIDGKRVSPGTIYLKPNQEYAVHGSKEGFENYSQKQYIDENNSSILVALAAVSQEAQEWASQNGDKYHELEGLGGDAAQKSGEAFYDKNPIASALPYENFIYTIGWKVDKSDPSGNTIILTINAPEGARNAAIQQIRDLGYDPLDYKIEFSNYRNPFAL